MILLISSKKVCIVSFQVLSIFQLIRTQFFLYHEKITIFYSLLNTLPEIFKKLSSQLREQLSIRILSFCLAWNRFSTVEWLEHSTAKREVVGSNPTPGRSLFFPFWIFHERFWQFWGKFLYFTNNISELFRTVTDKL